MDENKKDQIEMRIDALQKESNEGMHFTSHVLCVSGEIEHCHNEALKALLNEGWLLVFVGFNAPTEEDPTMTTNFLFRRQFP